MNAKSVRRFRNTRVRHDKRHRARTYSYERTLRSAKFGVVDVRRVRGVSVTRGSKPREQRSGKRTGGVVT